MTSVAAGWLIGVMLTPPDEPAPLRHFFAVGHADRAKAEWTAVDSALLIGHVATSPVGGLEPVHMVAELTPHTVHLLGLKPREVRPLGWRWPRRWITLEPKPTPEPG
jgi:hypothetical protein